MISDAQNFMQVFLFALAMLFISLSIAYRAGIFPLRPEGPLPQNLNFMTVLGAYLAFLLVQFLIVPAFMIYFSVQNIRWSALSDAAHGWANISLMAGATLAVVLYTRLGAGKYRSLVWSRCRPKAAGDHFSALAVGCAYWFICYPLVVALGQLLGYVLHTVLQEPIVEQGAVQSIRNVADLPVLFALTIACVVFVVPVAEELLFRGYLQTWLRRYLAPYAAVLTASWVFALFHYSFSYGLSNFEILVPLFILSCFLGYLYESKGSLWASIGLHSFFNGMSVCVLYYLDF